MTTTNHNGSVHSKVRANRYRAELPYLSTDSFHHWTFPAKGLYAGGCQTGQAAATAFLKCLREARRAGEPNDSWLQYIALDMLGGKRMSDSLKGQVVGFFSTLYSALFECSDLMTGLDRVTFESLRAEMQKGLAYTKADEAKELRDAQSEQARRGWETRRRRMRQAEEAQA